MGGGPAADDAEAADAAHCRALVRAGDRDRFLAALFAPGRARPHLNALAAFAVELGLVRARVSEPMLARVRLQWWRDTLAESAAGATIASPLADAVARAMRAHALPPALLEAMIDARESELEGDAPETLTAFESHLDATEGALIALGALILTGRDLPDGARRPAGLALGLTRALTRIATPAGARAALPRDLASVHGPGGEEALLADLTATARHHLAAARTALSGLPRVGLAAVLPLATIEGDLARLERRPFSGPSGPLARQWAIWRAARRGRV